MGHRHFEGTMPKIAEQLERLNGNLEELLAAMTPRSADDAPSSAETSRPSPGSKKPT